AGSKPALWSARAVLHNRSVFLEHGSTVPSRCSEPRAASGRHRLSRGFGLGALLEQAVDGGTRAGHVRAERAERAELVRERRRGKVVRRERSEISGSERLIELGPSLLEAVRARECLVDDGGR